MYDSSLLRDSILAGNRRATPLISGSTTDFLGEAICAVGVFDGLHKGHQFLIEQTIAEAKTRGLLSVVVTFDPDPDELFRPSADVRKLMSNADRLAWLATCAVDYLLVIPFTPAFAKTEPVAFLETIFSKAFTPRGIHVGQDFRFGNHATGSTKLLREWGSAHDCALHAHPLLIDNGKPVTATRIREVLHTGSLKDANELLTRPFYLRARVVAGRQVGTVLGFPTANLAVDAAMVAIRDGVYGGFVYVDDRPYKAAISVGVPATFANVGATMEAHILDFAGDLYDHEVKVVFREHLREMRSFASVDELIATVNGNIEWVRANL